MAVSEARLYVCPICGDRTLIMLSSWNYEASRCHNCGKLVIPLATPQEVRNVLSM